MSKKKIVYNFITFVGLAIILCGAGFLLNSDTINALCRAPDGCTGCHGLIGNTKQILGWAQGTCERGGFTLTPDLSEPRFIHRTAKLNDGRVILTGGANRLYGYTNSVDIYDPQSNTITPVAPMNTVRWSHTATTLNNGKVLVVGGRISVTGTTPGANTLSSAEIYDPVANTWTYTGSMSVPRRSHTATLLPDGRVLIAGGGDRATLSLAQPYSSCEIYDPSTGMFTVVGDMTTPRQSQSAVLLDDGTVLINGGSTGPGTNYPTRLAEIFNPAGNSFTAVGPSVFPHLAQSGAKLEDGRVLIPGSYYNEEHQSERGAMSPECEIFDPVTRTFSATGPMHKQRIDIGGQLLLDGTVLVAGGVSTDPNKVFPAMFQTSAEVYDPKTGIWLLTGLMQDGRDEFSGIALDDGRIFISGGFTRTSAGSSVLKTAEIYTPGLIPQIEALRNVINDLPDSVLKPGASSKPKLVEDLENVAKYLGIIQEGNYVIGGEGSGGFDGKHVINEFGHFHRPGLHYPEINCSSCHGANLTGGAFAPSCYTCHGAKWLEGRHAVELDRALAKADLLIKDMDGCGNSPDAKDLITDCTEQKRVRSIVQVLRNTIDKELNPGMSPEVSISANPASGTEPLTVNFTSTANDPDGTIASYFWQFGDSQTSNEVNPVHTYSCDGTYTASLRVTDNSGNIGQALVEINVAAASGTLTYNCDAQPVFDQYCIGCHGSFGGLNLQTCSGLLAGGFSGASVVPGDANASLLYNEMASGDMPPSSTVPPEDIAKIGAWINSLDPIDPNFCD